MGVNSRIHLTAGGRTAPHSDYPSSATLAGWVGTTEIANLDKRAGRRVE